MPGTSQGLNSSMCARLQSGDGTPDDWLELRDVYGPITYNYCEGRGLQPHDAEEVVSQTLITIWKSIAQFRNRRKESFLGWVLMVALNNIRDMARRQEVRPRVVGGTEWGVVLNQCSGDAGVPSLDDYENALVTAIENPLLVSGNKRVAARFADLLDHLNSLDKARGDALFQLTLNRLWDYAADQHGTTLMDAVLHTTDEHIVNAYLLVKVLCLTGNRAADFLADSRSTILAQAYRIEKKLQQEKID